MTTIPVSRLQHALATLTAAHPYARKLLVGTDVNFGRESLQALARRTGGWIGWEACNLKGIASELAFVPLSERGQRTASDIEIAALVNEALDSAIESREVTGRFAELARSLGFRHALRDSLLEARTGGVSPDALRKAAPTNPSALAVAAVLVRYERLLTERSIADAAAALRIALDSFASEAPFVLGDSVIALAPSLSVRGLAGELLARLVAHGAVLLDADTPRDIDVPGTVLAATRDSSAAVDAPASLLAFVSGSASPTIDSPMLDRSLASVDLFVAATPAEEVREVCRRVIAEGLAWDDVEIVATDTDTYGIALDALAGRLDIGVTIFQGLPLARTRLGRALDRWLAFIGDGLPADALREALEAGEIGLPDSRFAPSRLAAELRTLAIGWGRARYDAALARVESGESVAGMRPREDESPEDFAHKREQRVTLHRELARLLRTVLATLPAVPERGVDAPVRTTVNALATATLAYLELVGAHGQAEQHAMQRMREQLAELAAIPQPETGFGSALAALTESLASLRAWPMVTSERTPRSSAGGMLHLTGLPHAGVTGRKRVFVVGLDAERSRGGVLQDPILSDRVRSAVVATAGTSAMATSNDRHASAAWRLGASLAGLRGRVTLSYATSAALDGREAGPSPLLLQAQRIVAGNAALSFADMRKSLVPPACAVPARAAGLLDARDVWLDALTDDALVLDGGAQTRDAFASLAAGLGALDAAQSSTASGHHGLVPLAGPSLDPLLQAEREISPSSLEQLAKCPLAWFYKYGLKLRAPRDPQYDEELWLDSLQRGSLLHEVYEQFVRDFMGRQADILQESAAAHLTALLDDALDRYRADVPPPSELVFQSESDALRADARAFLELEREQHRAQPAAVWHAVELPFGRQYDGSDSGATGTYSLADGRTFRLQGRADRLDKLPDDTLRVVDYKTGRSRRFERQAKGGAFQGGRQLQPALYASAIETAVGSPVGSFEYRFPTVRGENAIVTYSASELTAARDIVRDLLGGVSLGHFIATNDTSDCSFCDYGSICRTNTDKYHKTTSPRAAWAEQHGASLPLYALMRARRAQDALTTDVEGGE